MNKDHSTQLARADSKEDFPVRDYKSPIDSRIQMFEQRASKSQHHGRLQAFITSQSKKRKLADQCPPNSAFVGSFVGQSHSQDNRNARPPVSPDRVFGQSQKLTGRVELSSKFDRSSQQKTDRPSPNSASAFQMIRKTSEVINFKSGKTIEQFSKAMLERNSDQEATEDSVVYHQDHNQTYVSRVPENDFLPQKQFKKSSFKAIFERRQLTLDSLDFDFFDRVYCDYNSIWQKILNLSIDDNFVSLNEFERILRSHKAIDERPNAFCRFLLQTCSQLTENDFLIDFRLFFNSIFQALKRKRAEDPHVTFINAELFVVDHFWSCMFKRDQNGLKEGYANFHDFQVSLFHFFNQPVDPLLQIHEIEQIIQQCYNYLVGRNKRRDVISKKTVRKVVYKGHCQKIFIQALLRGNVQVQESLTTSESFQLTNQDKNNKPFVARDLGSSDSRSDIKPQGLSSADGRRDQKDSKMHEQIKVSAVAPLIKEQKYVQQTKGKPMTLCRQLEMSIVAEKLERAFIQAQVRDSFFKIIQFALRTIQEQAFKRSKFERDSLEENGQYNSRNLESRQQPSRMSAALRSPTSSPPLVICHKERFKFVSDQIGEYDFNQFQKLTHLNQQTLEIFAQEAQEREKKCMRHQVHLPAIIQTDESESRAESTFREHNTSTSGNVSEQVNTQIITSLIETENYNSKCLRELQERIKMLEQSERIRQPIKRHQYDISTDSLQDESKNGQVGLTQNMRQSQVTDETAVAHANPYIDESARTIGTNQHTQCNDTISAAANSNQISISRGDFQFNLNKEHSRHEHQKSSRNYNGGGGHTFGVKGRSTTVHDSVGASIEECYLEKLQQTRERVYKASHERQASISSKKSDKSVPSRQSHKRRETFNHYLDGELEQMIEDQINQSIVDSLATSVNQSHTNSLEQPQTHRIQASIEPDELVRNLAQHIDDYGDEAEMDFEANQEQRPRQTSSDFHNAQSYYNSLDDSKRCKQTSITSQDSIAANPYSDKVHAQERQDLPCSRHQSDSEQQPRGTLTAHAQSRSSSRKLSSLTSMDEAQSKVNLVCQQAQTTDSLQASNDLRDHSIQRQLLAEQKQLQHYIKKYRKVKQRARHLIKTRDQENEHFDNLVATNQELNDLVEGIAQKNNQLEAQMAAMRSQVASSFLNRLNASRKRQSLLFWNRRLQVLRSNRYSILLQRKQLTYILNARTRRLLHGAMREWIENYKGAERMQEIKTMQQMHHDFEDVIGHLNKFRVELCFTKIFGTLQAASIRNKKNALSKLQQHISDDKMTQKQEMLRSLRSQFEAEQRSRAQLEDQLRRDARELDQLKRELEKVRDNQLQADLERIVSKENREIESNRLSSENVKSVVDSMRTRPPTYRDQISKRAEAQNRMSHRFLQQNDLNKSASQNSVGRSFSEKAVLLRNQSRHIEAFANLHTMFRLHQLKQSRVTLKHVFEYLKVQQRRTRKPLISPPGRQIQQMRNSVSIKHDFMPRNEKVANSYNAISQASGQNSSSETLVINQRFPSTQGSQVGRFASSGFINSQSSGQIILPHSSYAQDVQTNIITLSSSYGGFNSSGGAPQIHEQRVSNAMTNNQLAAREAREKLAQLSQERLMLEQRHQQIELQKMKLKEEREMRKLQLRQEIEYEVQRSSRNGLEAPRILNERGAKGAVNNQQNKSRSASAVSSTSLHSNNSSKYVNTTQRHNSNRQSIGGKYSQVSPFGKKKWNV